MKIFVTRISILIVLILCQRCNYDNASYRQCEQADANYLACSLVVYQSYAFCSESANALTGTSDAKAAAKFNCDGTRLTGLFVCEDAKKKACGKL
jgi:hypothetical protein